MKKLTSFILKKYSQMSGDKKIRLGMSLSETGGTGDRTGDGPEKAWHNSLDMT